MSPSGEDGAAGTQEEPLRRIQAGIERAKPGDTVRALPGEYREGLRTVRPGKPDAPITITGPPDAVVRPAKDNVREGGVGVYHSHIHITGLTLNGLSDGAEVDTPRAYARGLIAARPPTWESSYPDYLTDVKLMPHRIGNARMKLISAFRVNQLEIGEFEIIGPAGVDYYVGGKDGYVLGEVVSIGRSTNNYGTESYPWPGPDRSHDIHVHHIANVEGYPHTELVKLHLGHYDVTVEYCTDSGGFGRSGGAGSSVEVASGSTVVRWCSFENGEANGIRITAPDTITDESVRAGFESVPSERMPGRYNSVYSNRFAGLTGEPIVFSGLKEYAVTPSNQNILCENDYDGASGQAASKDCPVGLPDGNGVGHTGGDSPWA